MTDFKAEMKTNVSNKTFSMVVGANLCNGTLSLQLSNKTFLSIGLQYRLGDTTFSTNEKKKNVL